MIRNNILSRYPLILFWLTSLSQVLALLVIYQGVSPITFQTVMMFSIVTILVIFSYVCSVVHFKSILLKFFFICQYQFIDVAAHFKQFHK